MKPIYKIGAIGLLLLYSFKLLGAEINKQDPKKTEADSSDEQELFPNINQIFDNPFFNEALNAGSQVANNAFDSLLQAVFYNLLNNKFSQKISNNLTFNEALTRKIFSTGEGKYVIADRINLGPSYLKTYPNIFKKIPVSLFGNIGVDLLSIYLRSDPQRIIESESLPKWRYFFNIWFGIIPFLEMILPPAFDANNLYDPLREIESGFSFPVNVESFKKMELGTIQSYAYQGSVALPINIDGYTPPYIVDILNKLKLLFTVPYTLFVQGEYRINVLKRSKNIAWVGLTKFKKGGHSLAGFVGNTIYLLTNSVGKLPWKGVPLNFSPIDLNAVESLVDKLDIIYEFDLSKKSSHEAYISAISGDFSFGNRNSLPDGVLFHFSQDGLSTETEISNSKNFLLIFKTLQNSQNTKAEIKVNDPIGQFFVLETTNTTQDSNFNIFTGEQSVTLSNEIELNVDKMPKKNGNPNDLSSFEYIFYPEMTPFQFIVKLQIKDRYANSTTFNRYIDLLRKTIQLPLHEIPQIPEISEKKLARSLQKSFFTSPNDGSFNTHPGQTNVGKFSANGFIVFDADNLSDFLSKDLSTIKDAFYLSYQKNQTELFSNNMEYFRSYAAYPLRIFNYKSRSIDAYKEIQYALKTISKIKNETSPVKIWEMFYSLLKTDYPYELVSTLYLLSKIHKIPRKVSLYISPSSELDDPLRKTLEGFNNKTFSSDAKFPPQERYRTAKNKLSAYIPTSLEKYQPSLKISNLSIFKNFLRIHIKGKMEEKIRLFITIHTVKRLKLIEETIGKKLLEAEVSRIETEESLFEIPLIQNTKLLGLKELNEIDEDEKLVIAISTSSTSRPFWSENGQITLEHRNGRLLKAVEDK